MGQVVKLKEFLRTEMRAVLLCSRCVRDLDVHIGATVPG